MYTTTVKTNNSSQVPENGQIWTIFQIRCILTYSVLQLLSLSEISYIYLDLHPSSLTLVLSPLTSHFLRLRSLNFLFKTFPYYHYPKVQFNSFLLYPMAVIVIFSCSDTFHDSTDFLKLVYLTPVCGTVPHIQQASNNANNEIVKKKYTISNMIPWKSVNQPISKVIQRKMNKEVNIWLCICTYYFLKNTVLFS